MNKAVRTAWGGALSCRCPRCREGRVFQYPWYDFRRFQKMNIDCPRCGLHFEVEPGFFWGAMYVSYGMAVALFIASFVGISMLVEEAPIGLYVGVLLFLLISLLPLIFRYSRILMLYGFSSVRYEPNSGFKGSSSTKNLD